MKGLEIYVSVKKNLIVIQRSYAIYEMLQFTCIDINEIYLDLKLKNGIEIDEGTFLQNLQVVISISKYKTYRYLTQKQNIDQIEQLIHSVRCCLCNK